MSTNAWRMGMTEWELFIFKEYRHSKSSYESRLCLCSEDLLDGEVSS